MTHDQPPLDLKSAFRERLADQEAELITRFAAVMRNATVYGPNNETWAPLVDALRRALSLLGRTDGSVFLEVADGQLSVNGALARASFDQMQSFDFLVRELSSRGLKGLRFQATGAGKRMTPTAEDIKGLAYILLEHADPRSYSNAEALLAERGVAHIGVITADSAEQRIAAERRDWQTQAFYVFLMGISASREIHLSLRAGKAVGFKRAKRFVQSAVDLLIADKRLVIALTTIKNYLDYLHNHAVNSCLLSLLVGEKLGFEKRRLGDLGLATFLRDVGRATVPEELLAKQGQLTPEEWETLQFSRSWAVTRLLRFRGFSDGTLRQVLVAFEHGSTRGGDRSRFNLYSRVAEFANAFDAMTTSRPYRKRPMIPHEAMTHLYEGDLLSKAFLHTLGVYPPGSFVLLNTGELAIVSEPPGVGARLEHPRALIIARSDGSELASCSTVDTSEVGPNGRFLRTITRAIDPSPYKINVACRLFGGSLPTEPDRVP